MKIAFFETDDEDKKFLAESLKGEEMVFFAEKLTTDNTSLVQDAQAISVFINSELRKEILDLLPNLRFIATRSTGYDHIDCAYAEQKGIMIATVPSYGSRTVAEFTFGLILNLSRKICDADRELQEHDSFDISKYEGFDLYGKTIGVIGTGRIGKNVIRIAKGFEMNVLATDAFPDNKFADDMGFRYVTLNDLLSQSDIITIHVPYAKKTHHLINDSNIGFVKKGAYLINTARGEIIDTEILLKALKDGTLAGAGLDVLEGERYIKDEIELLTNDKEDKAETKEGFKTLLESHALIHFPHIIATPHIAFFSREAKLEILKTTAENIKNFKAETPQNLVKK